MNYKSAEAAAYLRMTRLQLSQTVHYNLNQSMKSRFFGTSEVENNFANEYLQQHNESVF